ncbi:ATP-binding protein [Micromonospora rosaria]|uniref:ATP-binding protein n=2 Tax=Micromonospora rosaria TaxID=47874 RepID=A0A136PVB1_9ACTN|nr:ATP-binding protein [Micromonospora rosaria]
MQRYREYLLASAAARHRLWLFNPQPPDWQQPYLTGATQVDVLDRDAVLAQARELAANRPVRGVLSWDETLVVNTAHVAAALGLPGATVDGIEACRDKHRTRRLLTAAGLPQPRYGWADDAEAAVTLAEHIGFPVVVKPRGMGASIGVALALDAPQARAAFQIADEASRIGAVAYHGGALVEEYLTGPEISMDAAVVDGEYVPLFLARKQVGMHPYFEELGHVVDPADPLREDPDLLRILRAAHQVIGLRYGITHTELKLTDCGPVIVEINGRLGGDLIPLLGSLATGIDPGAAVVDVALARRPQVDATRHRVVGIRFGYPPADCRVDAVQVPAADEQAGILHAAVLVEPGTELRLPPGGYISRHSYVICAGATAGECDDRLAAAAAAVRMRGQALTGTSAG